MAGHKTTENRVTCLTLGLMFGYLYSMELILVPILTVAFY